MHILLLFNLRDNKSCKDLPKMLKHEFYLKVAKFQKVSVCVQKVDSEFEIGETADEFFICLQFEWFPTRRNLSGYLTLSRL